VLIDIGSRTTTELLELMAMESDGSLGGWLGSYPFGYHPPEVAVGGNTDLSGDVWALGCVIYWAITGSALFTLDALYGEVELPSDEETQLKQICRYVEVLGPMPAAVRALWEDADDQLAADGTLLDPPHEDKRALPLEQSIRQSAPPEMGGDELGAFIEFIRLMICFDPAERKSTEELQQHRWVTDFETE
jgi:serine/threonine protein kinase